MEPSRSLKKLQMLFVSFTIFSSIVSTVEAVEYLGVEACSRCHMPHYDSWSETRMSKAFELLKPGISIEAKKALGFDPQYDFTKEPYCLGCHTTGYGENGGFSDLSSTPDMVGVQCEMCHGPGGNYAKMMYKKRGTYRRNDFEKAGLVMPTPENNICVKTCHNESNLFYKADRTFDFTNRKAIGTHKHDLRSIAMGLDLF